MGYSKAFRAEILLTLVVAAPTHVHGSEAREIANDRLLSLPAAPLPPAQFSVTTDYVAGFRARAWQHGFARLMVDAGLPRRAHLRVHWSERETPRSFLTSEGSIGASLYRSWLNDVGPLRAIGTVLSAEQLDAVRRLGALATANLEPSVRWGLTVAAGAHVHDGGSASGFDGGADLRYWMNERLTWLFSSSANQGRPWDYRLQAGGRMVVNEFVDCTFSLGVAHSSRTSVVARVGLTLRSYRYSELSPDAAQTGAADVEDSIPPGEAPNAPRFRDPNPRFRLRIPTRG